MKLRIVSLLLLAALLTACGLDQIGVSVGEPALESPSEPQVVTVVTVIVVATPTPEPIEASSPAPPQQDSPSEPAATEPASDNEETGAGETATSEPRSSLPSGSWQPIPDLPRHINDLVADSQNPQVLYAATGSTGSGSGVYKSEDGGLTWRLVADGLPSEDVRALAFGPGDLPTLYATVGNRGDVFASNDGAQSWNRLGAYDMTGFKAQLAAASGSGDMLFVTEDVRGLYRSPDGGYAWMPVTEGLPNDEYGVSQIQSLAIDPTDPNTIYVGTGSGPFGGNGVYKSTDGGETWFASNRGMLDYSITALAIDPSVPQTVYAGCDGGEFFKTSDGGQTWVDLSDRLPAAQGGRPTVSGVLVNPAAPETIYMLVDRVGAMISSDKGETWRTLGMPGGSDSQSFSAITLILDPEPVLIVALEGEGGWRYGAE